MTYARYLLTYYQSTCYHPRLCNNQLRRQSNLRFPNGRNYDRLELRFYDKNFFIGVLSLRDI